MVAVEDSAALAAEALAAAVQADPGKNFRKMNYKNILNKKEPPNGGSFNAYLLS
jgi:hypothetical protein